MHTLSLVVSAWLSPSKSITPDLPQDAGSLCFSFPMLSVGTVPVKCLCYHTKEHCKDFTHLKQPSSVRESIPAQYVAMQPFLPTAMACPLYHCSRQGTTTTKPQFQINSDTAQWQDVTSWKGASFFSFPLVLASNLATSCSQKQSYQQPHVTVNYLPWWPSFHKASVREETLHPALERMQKDSCRQQPVQLWCDIHIISKGVDWSH